MNISEIISDVNYRGEDKLYPLSNVKSEHDKNRLEAQGFIPGYTEDEWKQEFPMLPSEHIFYRSGLDCDTVYYDKQNLIYLNLHIFGRDILSPFEMTREEFQKQILSAIQHELSHLEKKEYIRLFISMPDGLRMENMPRLLEIEGPTPCFFNTFLSIYIASNFVSSTISPGVLKVLPQCKTDEMKSETKERLSRLERCAPNEIRVYRGVCDKSSPIETAVSWTPNINVAYFFATRLGKKPSIITGRVKEDNIIEYLTEDCDNVAEEEVLVTPGTVIFEKEEPLYDMDSEEIKELLPEAMGWYHPFRDILKELYEVSDNTNTAHDALHSLRVLLLASFLGVHEKLDYEGMNALCFAAVYHEIGRGDDTANSSHGKESEKIYEEKEARNKIASTLIRAHCLDDDKAKILIRKRFRDKDRENVWKLLCILKDADALDRLRFGMNMIREGESSGLDVRFLRTPFALKLVPYANQSVDYLTL